MKKEKLFKVGVINESTVDVVKDMTTFYTSDTELWLGFELSEVGVEFDSAEILLFNIDDKSFVVRSVVKIDNKYWYELDMDIIAHHGEWTAQLQFTKNNEVYATKHFNFRIENDLSSERPPKLIDITNWSNIKQTADSLIAEMKVAVTEAIEAESERQATFETAESERNQTFESNELTRQTQELEREKSETQRQTVFDNNETNRIETFNTNEATRQENETTRQQAESQRQSTFETNESERQIVFETAEQGRQSAENERIEAETLRMERDINRETEIANIKNDLLKNTSVKLTNRMSNGNFSNGLDGWEITGILTSGSTVFDGKLHVYGKNSGSTTTWPAVRQDSKTVVGHTHYFYIEISDMPENSTSLFLQDRNTVIMTGVRNGNHSKIETVKAGQVLPKIYLNHTIQANDFVDYKVDHIIVIDLTEIFGLGNEPTKEVMDWVIKENDYFEELTLIRDDIQQYEINQLRKAVLALGGTI